jgi:CDP-glucose 4,6-dehydratase
MGGYDPYSSSKGCAELVVAAYRSSFFHPDRFAEHGTGIATARAGNVIGGGDWSLDRLIPDVIAAHARGAELTIRNPRAVRPWQFVLEPLWGYLMLAEHLHRDGRRFTEAWNFGPRDDDVLPVETVVRKLSALLKGGVRYRIEPDLTLHEAGVLKLDCSKASARLGWQPRTNIDDALRLTVEWQNEQRARTDMQAISLGQIQAFESSAPT